MEDYRVQLDFYDGPMDLLLYLVRKNEVDIQDIPIARITEQYCRYVEMLRAVDLNTAAEFLLMAAWLMEIKTRMLLPAAAPEQAGEGGETPTSAADALAGGADPRAELVRQLLAYKRFKDLADELGEAAALQALKFPRAGIDWERVIGSEDDPAVDLADVQIWDLFEAFGKLMDATGRSPYHQVTYDDTPIQEHAADIVDRLTAGGPMLFEKLFEGRGRGEIVGLFLALLELIRQKRVRIEQEHTFGPILLALRPAGEAVAQPPSAVAPSPSQREGRGEGTTSTQPTPPPFSPDQDARLAATQSPGLPGRRGARRSPSDEPAGVTWVEPDEDEDSLDLGLRAIDQELKAIKIPADPDLLAAGGAAGPAANDSAATSPAPARPTSDPNAAPTEPTGPPANPA